MFAQVINNQVVETIPVVPDNITLADGSTVLGFAGSGTDNQIAFGYYPVIDLTPEFNNHTHKLGEPQYVIVDSNVELSYSIIPLDTTELANVNQSRVAQLWQSATAYEQRYISGSANNIITQGVIKSKPKATAMQNWINSIWAEYYTRKADTANFDFDFSSVGQPPYTTQDIITELAT